MALKIPSSDRVLNYWDYTGGEIPEGFDPSDPTIVNADWVMRMLDKIVNGNYATKSFNIVPSVEDLPSNAEQGQTAYVLNGENKSSFYIYNGTEWVNPLQTINTNLNTKLDLTGGTLTGVLTSTVINEGGSNPTAPFTSKMSNIIIGTFPQEGIYPYIVKITDASDNTLGSFEYDYRTDRYGVGIVCKKWGVSDYTYLKVGWKDDGEPYFEFPKCTTPATTTSTAANDKVAVITYNYKNGTSWIRQWSDGWVEQGGRITTSVSSQSVSTAQINFIIPFVDTSYFFATENTGKLDSDSNSIYCAGRIDKATTYASILSKYISGNGTGSAGSVTYYWFACGYKGE